VGQMVFLGAGLGATTAPATESIMGSLSADKAGIGSAVNDTTRELGETLGDGSTVQALPPEARALTEESVGAARLGAESLGVGCLVAAGVAAAGAVFASRFLPASA
jgi:hypothetical protein